MSTSEDYEYFKNGLYLYKSKQCCDFFSKPQYFRYNYVAIDEFDSRNINMEIYKLHDLERKTDFIQNKRNSYKTIKQYFTCKNILWIEFNKRYYELKNEIHLQLKKIDDMVLNKC